MADTSKASFKLRYLLIACLPALVFLLNIYILQNYGDPVDVPPDALAEFNAYKEGAARISTLAAFILFMGASAGALLFFTYTLRMLDVAGRWTMGLAFLALAAAALLFQHGVTGRNAEDYIGRSLACWATGYTKKQSDSARTIQKAKAEGEAKSKVGAQPPRRAESRQPPQTTGAAGKAVDNAARPVELAPGVAVKYLPDPEKCSAPRFRQFQNLMTAQALAMILAFSALVFGALCCLAERKWPDTTAPAEKTQREPSAGTVALAPAPVPVPVPVPVPAPAPVPVIAEPAPDPELDYWERQSEWLNTYLYLAALLLGTALVFLNALLRWPAYALIESDAYTAYVAAMVSYYGFTFSVMLSSFYIPTAILLTSKVRARAKKTDGEAKLPGAFQGPLQLLKIVLGLFSTALAGVLPGILEMIS